MINKEHIDTILTNGGDVFSTDGDKIGSIGQFYLDDETDRPSWVTAKTGLFGTSESFIPLEGASVDGNDVRVPYTKEQVKDAPRIDPDGHLSPEEEDRLYQHYQTNGSAPRTYGDAADRDADYAGTAGTRRTDDVDAVGGVDTARGSRDDEFADTGRGTVGRDTSGPTTDDAMTRSEEQLNVGTEQRETGRARLRKYVTTENVTKTVPVQREEVRLEREPINDANRDAALDGPDLSEEEHEVTLHEERPVVEKETVPVERVRLDKETVTDEQTIDEDVRKEHIDTDGIDQRSRR